MARYRARAVSSLPATSQPPVVASLSGYVENIDLAGLSVAPGGRVADVGCADGRLAEGFARAGLEAVGVEPAAYLRERFERRMREAGLDATVVDGTVERLPFEDASLDAATITEVLEHVDDPRPAMAELRRVLRPGGVLCLSVPTERTERLFSRLHPRYLSNATHVRIFSRESLTELIESSGFEIVRWEGRNFVPSVSWVFHALLRSESDHAGAIHQHHWVDYALGAMWRALRLVRLEAPVLRLGNRLLPKSWYVYCRAAR